MRRKNVPPPPPSPIIWLYEEGFLGVCVSLLRKKSKRVSMTLCIMQRQGSERMFSFSFLIVESGVVIIPIVIVIVTLLFLVPLLPKAGYHSNYGCGSYKQWCCDALRRASEVFSQDFFPPSQIFFLCLLFHECLRPFSKIKVSEIQDRKRKV